MSNVLSYFPPLLWAMFLWLEHFTKESEVVVNVVNTDLQTDVMNKHHIPWFFSGNGIVSLSLLSKFRISRISLWKQRQANSADSYFTVDELPSLHSSEKIQVTLHQEKTAWEYIWQAGAGCLPLYIFNVGSYQPLLLQEVDGRRGSVFQDGSVRAFIHPEVHPRLWVRSFRAGQRRQPWAQLRNIHHIYIIYKAYYCDYLTQNRITLIPSHTIIVW